MVLGARVGAYDAFSGVVRAGLCAGWAWVWFAVGGFIGLCRFAVCGFRMALLCLLAVCGSVMLGV